MMTSLSTREFHMREASSIGLGMKLNLAKQLLRALFLANGADLSMAQDADTLKLGTGPAAAWALIARLRWRPRA